MKQKQITIITALIVSVFVVGSFATVALAEKDSSKDSSESSKKSDDKSNSQSQQQGKNGSGRDVTSGKPNEPKPRHDGSHNSLNDDQNGDDSNTEPDKKPFVGKKLERIKDKKLENCEKQETKVNEYMKVINDRSTHRYDRVTKVYGMTKDFVTRLKIEIENYDTRVSDIDAKQVAAKNALDALTALPDFSCDSEGPKAEIETYLEERNTKIDAMVSYRDAVKKLLLDAKKAVHGDGTV